MPEFESAPKCRFPSLCLDYGVDEQLCDNSLSFSERGMRFISRWQFSLGTQLSVACVWPHARLGTSRVTLEGIVVWCGRIRDVEEPAFDTTVLFLELPDELRQSLREFSFQLERG